MIPDDLSTLPTTPKEAKQVGSNIYFTGRSCKHGHITYRYTYDKICSTCAKLKSKLAATVKGGNARRWAAKTPEQLQEIYVKRKDYYYRTHEDRLLEKKKSYGKLKAISGWLESRRLKVNQYRLMHGRPIEKSNPLVKKKYKMSDKGRISSTVNDAKRRSAQLKRTPAWLTETDLWMIEQAYELSALRTKLLGFSWHVDHVIPLQGKYVSGLHVPTNFQVIPATENLRKANKHLPA
jgi:hypothetical protein